MRFAQPAELEAFLGENPDIQLLELLMPDVNGILRCKRIQRREFGALYEGHFAVPKTVPMLGIRGDFYEGVSQSVIGGDPDQTLRPIRGTLARVPWLDSPVAQVLTGYAEDNGDFCWMDPRAPLENTLKHYADDGLHPVVATELEFYLLAESDGDRPEPLRGRIPGTGLKQQGIQYCMPDDLIDCDAFLNDVRIACETQRVPMTAIHSEFSAGQWEINTHHQNDPVCAADQGLLLRRIVKAVARRHGMAATFMAKPFAETAGNGLHVHVSVYDGDDRNIFAAAQATTPPELTATLRHAVGGLAATLTEGMAMFAPNPNSYRRFKAGSFAPSGKSWAYDHREATLRIPVSSEENRRIEHRVSGADANPYLVLAAVLAGVHMGINEQIDPGEPLAREADLSEVKVTLPTRLDRSLQCLRDARVLPGYLGKDYCDAYASIRQGEYDDYHAQIPDLDYQWFLRAI